MSGITMSMPIKADFCARLENGDVSEISMDMSVTLIGQDISCTAYSDMKSVYVDSAGQKVKASLESFGLSSICSSIVPSLDVGEDILNGAERTVENGVTSVTAVFDGSAVKDQLIGMLDQSVTDPSSSQLDMSAMSLSDVTLRFTVGRDGYMSDMGTTFTLTRPTEAGRNVRRR